MVIALTPSCEKHKVKDRILDIVKTLYYLVVTVTFAEVARLKTLKALYIS
jgi:hypothetical protein